MSYAITIMTSVCDTPQLLYYRGRDDHNGADFWTGDPASAVMYATYDQADQQAKKLWGYTVKIVSTYKEA